jgi:hypothetical protein
MSTSQLKLVDVLVACGTALLESLRFGSIAVNADPFE